MISSILEPSIVAHTFEEGRGFLKEWDEGWGPLGVCHEWRLAGDRDFEGSRLLILVWVFAFIIVVK